MSGAEVLRQAAALMRSRAEDADSQGSWEVGMRYSRGADWIRPVYDDDGTVCEIHEGDADEAPGSCEGLATHIASWHPAVALAVADWLDATAERHAPVDNPWNVGQPCCQTCGLDLEGDEVGHCEDFGAALDVARAYLGDAAALPPDHAHDTAAEMKAANEALLRGGGVLP